MAGRRRENDGECRALGFYRRDVWTHFLFRFGILGCVRFFWTSKLGTYLQSNVVGVEEWLVCRGSLCCFVILTHQYLQ